MITFFEQIVLFPSVQGSPCDQILPPLNGAKACSTWHTAGAFCTVHCNKGYAFVEKPAPLYICTPNGQWRIDAVTTIDALPDCASKNC